MAYLYENLLTIAEQLLDTSGAGTAGRRRAISTAYYAVFRRLSSLCAASFALPPPMERETYDAVLRSLKHNEVSRVLSRKDAQDIIGKEIGSLFGELMSAREWADYGSATHINATKAKAGEKLTRAEAAKLVNDARAIIDALDALDERARHRLAILLAFAGKR